MPGILSRGISNLLHSRDELSFRNLRARFLPVILLFPLSVILGDFRYYDHSIALAGLDSHFLMYCLIGAGWLVLALSPKNLTAHVLKIAVPLAAALNLSLWFIPLGLARFVVYMAGKFLIGLCAGAAFFFFCFALNNVERLLGMILIQLYYGLYYILYHAHPALHGSIRYYGSPLIMLAFLVLCFVSPFKMEDLPFSRDQIDLTEPKNSGVPFVIGLSIVHYMIMCMFNYIEWMDNNVSSLAFGLGTLGAILAVVLLQLQKGKSALSIWLMFLALSLLGLGSLLYDAPLTFISGSFTYGLGDSLGYIIIFYLCGGAIKQSRSLKMFKIFCLVVFIKYAGISSLFSFYFNYFEVPNRFLAFGVVMVLVSICLMLMPFIQKRLFEADWTDGIRLNSLDEYSQPLAQMEELNIKDRLNLTPREEEVFTLLLRGIAPKEIAYTLKISYDTVNFHQKNLYRKLGIQSRAELFARYGSLARE
ncbi:MAG: helix-turn-helix transcriptional regulator [Treponema sp.]|nr:helix-turn-helix transcriptional regulator [Treponema sp.]